MIICLCEGVSKREIEHAAHNGAKCIEEVSLLCRAGQGCGSCHEQIKEILMAKKPVAPEMSCGISHQRLSREGCLGQGE